MIYHYIMINLPNLVHIGQVAVFYLPHQKWDETWGVKSRLHGFLINNYDAYTLDHNRATGFWRESDKHVTVQDHNVRYEVSFGGAEKIPAFIDFLSEICAMMGEKAIYLTMGKHSYHVLPKKENNEIREEISRRLAD